MANATKSEIEAGGAYFAEAPAFPVPLMNELDRPYWEGAARNDLLVQFCPSCDVWQWGPEWLCHTCHSYDLDWREVEPRGRIYSWERAWHPVHPALVEAVPYVVVLVELPHAGNIRMVGNLLGEPEEDVVIGAEVEAVFEHHTDHDPPYSLVHWSYI